MSDIGRVALAARVFTLAALVSLAALAGPVYLRGTLAVAVIALVAVGVSLAVRARETSIATAEGALVAALAVLSFPEQATITPYLVIPVLIGALSSGRRGLLQVLAVEVGVLVGVWLLWQHHWDRTMASDAFTWLTTAVGLALLGLSLRRTVSSPEDDASYRSAVGLIRRLEALSSKLSGGLDAVDIAEQIMEEADSLIPVRSAGVFVRSPRGEMVPLRYTAGTLPATMAWAAPISAQCWQYEAMTLREERAALPLMANDEILAVLVLEALQPIEAASALALRSQLARLCVQLQAALLFSRVRERATSQERQRIAREVHDGVAQDVASLGYLVDNLAGSTSDPALLSQVGALRTELTRVVTELRHSIFDLRHEMTAVSGLGESLSAYAQQISATSPMTVHVTLDESGPRLPGDTEHELLRIAQEAMTNARRHSEAANLWLRCTVRSPYAEVEVGDDGTRAHAPRADSQGLKIMRERAAAVGAELHVEAPEAGRPGTRVRVRVGAANR